ncbi:MULTISPECIES: histidine kinase [unclassified Streptomyces]|uniref:sensor histidine kinase n=1 Tax=unclassified Streptomyces TaxID=2593676 RepID=UPI001BECB12D|nr:MULTISPECIES: histidine kinase [unclassified Streptomyces]MBT2403481.1 sensor histidine kinase [Streptomyces sp. ISL-21]MBT2456794.1 sensor histidine kinase [Streptomyces sp. ISL-86]MBT2612843.1 sensor histidine kinase [Streptomyces sp. ISL-87]
MSKLTGWWKNRSSAGKVELYTRWSFHLFVLIEIVSFGLAGLASTATEAPTMRLLAILVMISGHAVMVGFLSSRALDWLVGSRERPVRLAVVTGVLTAVACLAVLVLRKSGGLSASVAPSLVTGMTCFATGSLVLCLKKVRHMWCVAPAAGIGTGAAVLVLGLSVGEAAGYTVGVTLTGLFLSLACGFSGWLLNTVYELDRARELQSQLAVAEERLRFGRDLHDVMGRNLAVIALKSELAVQLARRERPEAVDQMIEVQRIARESQREVRDVVRGYREADLTVELEGARGVLSAAGMDCRVEFEAGRVLPSEVQSALGWVVREATTNVLRHGDARSCVIRLSAQSSGPLTLLVENDGAPETPAGPPGSGLAGLRERLAVVDGTLQAGLVGGGRFRLLAEIPGQRLEVRA